MKIILVTDDVVLAKIRPRLDLNDLKVLGTNGPIVYQTMLLSFLDDDQTALLDVTNLVTDLGLAFAMDHKPYFPPVLMALEGKPLVRIHDQTLDLAISVKQDIKSSPGTCFTF
jgi:hypothetical protein